MSANKEQAKQESWQLPGNKQNQITRAGPWLKLLSERGSGLSSNKPGFNKESGVPSGSYKSNQGVGLANFLSPPILFYIFLPCTLLESLGCLEGHEHAQSLF